jgi:broad specificity phosphatase PhoE
MIVGIRHAQVWNPEGVVYARLAGFHLSDQGRADAGEMAAAVASAPVSAIYASPLERAVETAEILAGPHGLTPTIDDRLAEWAFWMRWQGLPWSRIRERDPELLEIYADDPGSPTLDEPLPAAAERLMRWARDAEAQHPEGIVLGVTHEAPLAAALLLGSGSGLGAFHTTHLPYLRCVRLRPGPPDVVDLSAVARSC